MVAGAPMSWRTMAGLLAAALAAMAAGCGGSNPPALEARTSLGYVVTDLFRHSDGFGWWDADVDGAGDKIGEIRLTGTTLIASGGGCGVYRWGPCDATLTDG